MRKIFVTQKSEYGILRHITWFIFLLKIAEKLWSYKNLKPKNWSLKETESTYDKKIVGLDNPGKIFGAK